MRRWHHVIINAKCSWLTGSPRGFRNRHHRIHSTGDYKNPPPPGEHAGLYAYHLARSHDPVSFDVSIRIEIVRHFVTKLQSLHERVIACSCSAEHLHCLCELDGSRDAVKKTIGKCKQMASHAVRANLPGEIWSAGGEYRLIKDLPHLHNVYGYIRTKQEAGTIVWSHREDEDWFANSEVGIVLMMGKRKRIRVFAAAQTPASER